MWQGLATELRPGGKWRSRVETFVGFKLGGAALLVSASTCLGAAPLKRIFVSGGFRIAAAHAFAYLMIGRRPEAMKIMGELDWPTVGSRQVQ